MTIVITFSALTVVVISVLCFLAVTAFCFISGVFDGPDPWGIGWMFGLIFYACGWAVPSLAAWAVWATWFR